MVMKLEIQKEVLVQTLEKYKTKGFDYLKKILANDYSTYLELVYILYNVESKEQELITLKLNPNKPEIDSIIRLFPNADWHEREIFEMFGIKFNKRKLQKLLLYEWNGVDFPLRKSFEWNKDYKKIK